MKKLSPLRLGFTFAGSFLGAGYVSGQEIWQFFGRFGIGALPGLALAMVLMGAVGVMTWELARGLDMTEMDRLVVEKNVPVLRIALSVVQAVMLFGFTVIMCAGGVALCVQQWKLPAVPCAVVMAAAVALVSLAGIPGLVNLFSGLVPALCAVTVAAAVAAPLMSGGIPAAAPAEPAFGGWPVSAVVFFAYNTFGVIGIIAPVGPMAADRKSIRRGVVIGCVILTAIALSVLVAMATVPASVTAEMPMLAVITHCFPWLAVPYAVLLLVVMFGAALGCLVALMTFLEEKFTAVRTHRIPFTAGLMAAALLGSLVGFSDLIGLVYPVFGWCGIGFLALLTLHWLHRRRELSS
ncbi:MAG: hypothetical protein E7445_02475 [Ruminococcaceae bacterium]|nr:hypothetical protein [Oscillospiraceae bacterium]